MVTAWTTDNVDFRGKHWQVSFPSVRPRPYQKPHPPLARACINRESIVEMARIGRPILLRGRSVNSVAADIALYRDTMAASGFDEESIQHNLDRIWVWRELHLAETDSQAMDEFLPTNYDAYAIMQDFRQRLNPPEFPMSQQAPPIQRDGYAPNPDPDAAENLVGSPEAGRGATRPDATRRHPQPDAYQPGPGFLRRDCPFAQPLCRTRNAPIPQRLIAERRRYPPSRLDRARGRQNV